MKVEKEMIDKEYRVGTELAKKILNPSIKGYRLLNKVSETAVGKKLRRFKSQQIFIDKKNSKSKVRVRVYKRKKHDHNCPGVLFLHGGGYILNYPENSHGDIKTILNSINCVVVAPDYTKSLDAPYPAALEDCYETLLWMKKNNKKLGFRSDQIFIMGESAGGGLTIALCMLARDTGDVSISYQFPISPMIDDRMNTPSMIDNDAPIWNEEQNKFAWDLYLKGVDEVPIYAAPSRCEDYSFLPPCSSYIGDLDPFLDETVEFFNNLSKFNVINTLKIFENVYHGFTNVNPLAAKTIEAKEFIEKQLMYASLNYFKKQP